MPANSSVIAAGSPVILANAPGGLRRFLNRRGEVVSVTQESFRGSLICFAIVQWEAGEGDAPDVPPISRNIPVNYLRPAPRKQRRGPATLNTPKDTRTEAERITEAGAWFDAHPEFVFARVGQGRASAVCHKCSREQKRLVRIKCVDCGSPGFSPSTNSTPGVPDSIIMRDGWPEGDGLLVEWKDSPTGTRQPEQAALEARGRIVVVWNLATCLTAVYRHECRILPNPVTHSSAVRDWLLQHDLLSENGKRTIWDWFREHGLLPQHLAVTEAAETIATAIQAIREKLCT